MVGNVLKHVKKASMVGPSIGSVCPCMFEPRERDILTRPVFVETHALGSSSTALGEMVDMDTT